MQEIKEIEIARPKHEVQEPNPETIRCVVSYAGEVVVTQVVNKEYDKAQDPIGQGI